MKKTLLFSLLLLLLISDSLRAQIVSITANPGTSGNIVLGTLAYHVSENIYTEAEIGASNFLTAGTAINRVDFSLNAVGATTTFTNVKIYMQNVSAATTSFASTASYSTAGYTEVYSGSIVVSTTGLNGVELTTPFIRTAGSNLQVMIERTDNIAHAGFVYISANGNNTSSTLTSARRYNSAVAPVSGTTAFTDLSAFRAAIRFKHNTPNEVAVDNIYTLGVAGRGVTSSYRAYITNNGTAARTNVAVTLNVSGANTFTNTVTIPTLAVGASGFVTFSTFTPTAVGTNNVVVSVPADDYTVNDSKTISQTVSANQLSYSVGTTESAGVNGGAMSLIAAKFAVPYGNKVTQANIYFSAAGNAYNVIIYSNVGGLPGAALDSVANLTTTVGLNNITFATPVSVSDSFYVAVRQLGTALATSYQLESPCRSNAYFLQSTPSAAWFDLSGNASNTFRMMIGVTMNSALPIQLNSFIGQLKNGNAILSWSTSSEINADKFEVERSSSNSTWSSIATVAAKGAANNTYQAIDVNLAIGKWLYRLKMIDKDGKFSYSQIVSLELGGKGLFVLGQNYPNPVKGSTQLSYQVNAEAKVIIELMTNDGRKIATLVNQQQSIGSYNMTIDLAKYSLASGNYTYRMIAVDKNNQELFQSTKTLTVVK